MKKINKKWYNILPKISMLSRNGKISKSEQNCVFIALGSGHICIWQGRADIHWTIYIYILRTTSRYAQDYIFLCTIYSNNFFAKLTKVEFMNYNENNRHSVNLIMYILRWLLVYKIWNKLSSKRHTKWNKLNSPKHENETMHIISVNASSTICN